MRSIAFLAACCTAVGALAVAGCANSPGLTTASVAKPDAKPAVDPTCSIIRSQIDQVTQEGTVGRLEKAAEGSTRSVMVKRAALARAAELNRLNTDYRQKCSNPALATAAAKPAVATETPAVTRTSGATTTTATTAQAQPATAQAATTPTVQ